MTRPRLIKRLVCFLVGHDLCHYRLTYWNQTRLGCRRCSNPHADTLKDKWHLIKSRSTNRTRSDDELPF